MSAASILNCMENVRPKLNTDYEYWNNYYYLLHITVSVTTAI